MEPREAPADGRTRFMALAAALVAATDQDERARLREELARLTFGDPPTGRPEPKPSGRI